jgi:hypothetical protein
MADFKCTLGNRERKFLYTRKDREDFEEMFGGQGMWRVIREQVLALNEKDEPTPGGTVKAQRALVWIGLRHSGPKVTQDAVGKWLDELGASGGNEFAVYSTAANAVLASGVLGIKYEPPVDEEEADPKEASDSTATEPSTSGS